MFIKTNVECLWIFCIKSKIKKNIERYLVSWAFSSSDKIPSFCLEHSTKKWMDARTVKDAGNDDLTPHHPLSWEINYAHM